MNLNNVLEFEILHLFSVLVLFGVLMYPNAFVEREKDMNRVNVCVCVRQCKRAL